MKKIRFLLTACLLVSMLTFTGCGNQTDTNKDAIPDDQQNNTIMEDVDDVGEDVKDGVEDAADDVKDAVDGTDKNDKDNKDNNDNINTEDRNGENMGQ